MRVGRRKVEEAKRRNAEYQSMETGWDKADTVHPARNPNEKNRIRTKEQRKIQDTVPRRARAEEPKKPVKPGRGKVKSRRMRADSPR